MKEFSKAQQEAIDFYKGPAMVVAGPGSGKTTVITQRIYNLIFKYKVAPENILVVTFTKAAAINMSLRFKSLVAGRTYPVFFGTFHSIFFRILRMEKDYPSDSILSEYSKYNILKEIVIRLKLRVPSVDEFVKNISSEIGKVKGNNYDIKHYIPRLCKKEIFEKVYMEYESAKKYEKKIDFEDMLYDCYRLLKNNACIRKKWQDIFKFILVDEVQDINQIQYDIIKLFLDENKNLFVVGDDDQSIYGFRGSRPEIMINLKNDLEDIKTIVLSQNYRSTPQIVECSNRLIKKNAVRLDKDIFSTNSSCDKPEIKRFKNAYYEIKYVVKKIKEYEAKGIEPSEMVVLVRNNSYIKDIAKILYEEGINTNSKKTKNMLYTSHIARDICDYMKGALNWKKSKLCLNEGAISVLNIPDRGLSRRIIIDRDLDVADLKNIYAHNKTVIEEIKKMDFHMKMISKLDPYGAINYIKNVIGYESYLRKTVNKADSLKRNLDLLNRLYNEATNYKTLEDWIDYYMVQNSNIEPIREEKKEDEKLKVQVMTMHNAKGLEYKVVFIVHANQGIIPGSRACRERDFCEERRLFYVAMTRAIEYLHILYIEEASGYHIEPSMFIGDIMEE